MTTSQSTRGRPLKPFLIDDDRYAVAYLHALTRVKKHGQTCSIYKASQLSALLHCKINNIDLKEGGVKPKISSSLRKCPVPQSLKVGKYIEIDLETIGDHRGKLTFDAHTRRLQGKYKKWIQGGSLEAVWLDLMAVAVMVTLHPKTAIRQGLPPKRTCKQMAKLAGEADFAEAILLPLLKSAIKHKQL